MKDKHRADRALRYVGENLVANGRWVWPLVGRSRWTSLPTAQSAGCWIL